MGHLDLYPGAIAGYRAFRLFAGRLYSLTCNHGGTHFEWGLGVNEARCSLENHRSPDWYCGCGFWAYKDLDGVLSEPIAFPCHDHATNSQLKNVPVVLMLMAGWGKVVEDEFGFRCQYARPVAAIEATARVPSSMGLSYGYSYGTYRFEAHNFGVLRSVKRKGLPALVEELGLTTLERQEPEPLMVIDDLNTQATYSPQALSIAVQRVMPELEKFGRAVSTALTERLSSAWASIKKLLVQCEEEANLSPREVFCPAAVGGGALSYAEYRGAVPVNRKPWLPGYMRQKGRG